MRFSYGLLIGALLCLGGCDYLSGDDDADEHKLKGERYEVLAGSGLLKEDSAAQGIPVVLPDAQQNVHWYSRQDALALGHLNWANSGDNNSTTIGEGNDFEQGLAPTPIIADDMLVAMDASGYISAHKLGDLSNKIWQNDTLSETDDPAMLGGGLIYDSGVIYVSTGYGRVAAIDAKTGKTKWKIRVGAPIRGAPAMAEDTVVVLTADNQTIALRANDGQPRWEHRGIRENAGFFSTTSPIISDGLVISAYSSGEVFAFRLQTGRPVWGDTVSGNNRTSAAAAFAGINADPVVQDGVVYIVNAGGGMTASAVLNGRPLWQQDVAAHVTPWAAGNMLFVLTAQHQLVALLKRDGSVRWTQNLAIHDDDNGRDITPQLFAPILAGGKVLVADNDGNLQRFDPQTGKHIDTIDISSDLAAAPIIADNKLYLLFSNATLQAIN